ncbi:MAG TPA: pyridoxamine 5'-phosphate oxidase [Pseudonocardiaceae bacterium]|nr:pyridoxamine 5'-phosphate oxidase [Pseudonocardiaceae bacterium]
MTHRVDGSELGAVRVVYSAGELDEGNLAGTWHEQLAEWLADAVGAGLPEPNAMVLATADADGRPSSRTVLAKGLDACGVVFFTNFTSRKMHDLGSTCYASATFPWIALHRQVHVRGPIEKITAAETATYWATRPRGSQLGAWASPQSAVLRDRRTLDCALEQATRQFADVERVPVPPHWGGVRICPESVEFWQGRPNRMHDRLRYVLRGGGDWAVERLAP